jgi:hypothetical protein
MFRVVSTRVGRKAPNHLYFIMEDEGGGTQTLATRRVLTNATILSVIVVGCGCVLFLAKETRYLLTATDRATTEEVRQHLGQPSTVTPAQAGETLWTYRIREFVQGGNNVWNMTGDWWCDDYALTFDAQGILRHWGHTSQKCG